MDNTDSRELREKARELFLHFRLTQAQIAEKCGVSQKTISLWAIEGKWKEAKKLITLSPDYLKNQIFNEIAEINRNIAAREPGQRYATRDEAYIRKRLFEAVDHFEDQFTIPTYIQVFMAFISWVYNKNIVHAQQINRYADDFLKCHWDMTGTHPHYPITPDIDNLHFYDNPADEVSAV